MLIGIDASHLNPPEMSGTQNYLYNLIHNISLIDKRNNYIVYTRHNLSEYFFKSMVSNNNNFSHYNVKDFISWTQVGLARSVFRDKVDVLISPWQTMPIVHPLGLKIISIIHGLEYTKLRFGPTMYTALFSDQIISVSEFTKNELRTKFRVPEKKVTVIYEGVDSAFFYKRNNAEIQNVYEKYTLKKPYIFFVGYMVPRKNLARLIKAFCQVNQELDERYDLVLAGKVPDENKSILSLPESLSCSKNIKFLGYVPNKDLPALMSGAVLLSYVSLSEGFGLPVLEGMSCQVPVLTSNTGALPEVSGGAAYLVSPYDVKDIRKGMKELLQNEKMRLNFIQKGREHVKAFDWQDTASKVLTIIEAYDKS